MGVKLNQIVKTVFGLKDAGVVGKQAKKQPHQKHFKLVAAVAVLLKRIVQLTHCVHRHPIDGLFFPDALLAVAGDEVEQAKVLVKLCQRKAVNLVLIEVVQFKVPEVAQQDVARLFVRRKAGKIIFSLMEGLDQTFAPAFVLNQQRALPEQVNVAVLAADFFDALFKRRYLTALDAKHVKKFVPKTFSVSVFTFHMPPLLGKRAGTVGYFFPVEWH